MQIQTINPATEEILASYDLIDDKEVELKLEKAQQAFLKWKLATFEARSQIIAEVAKDLRENSSEYAKTITLEMGKPLKEAIAEVEKSAWVCEHFAATAPDYLSAEYVETEAASSYVQFDPLGVILEVMPWNFPFWQVFRVSAPALMAGNVCVLKHSSNTPGCALVIEKIFAKASPDLAIFQTLMISSAQIEAVLKNRYVQGVSLTGSEKAGSAVAAIASREIKKSVMELGGSDPFIVMDDADIDQAVNSCSASKYHNAGQVCLAAKRLFLHEKIYDTFVEKYIAKTKTLVVGDPFSETTNIGPLSSKAARDEALAKIQENVAAGAKILYGGEALFDKGYYMQPTVLTDIKPGMSLYGEEIFAPVTMVAKFSTLEEAIKLANDTRYGLAASVWTDDPLAIAKFINELEAGSVFVNALVKTDPRLPVGGIKKSGYGREIGKQGALEFVNKKTIWIA
jgi:succinate-semialdehyde dehydrogenase/glutarate-semialdehyde dehydrogenase